MREVNFAKDVVYGMAHLLGVDPVVDLLNDQARGWVSSINNHVRRGWGFWPWPEFEVTEERAFRQVFYIDAIYQSGQGEASEVYYPATEKYYRMTANAAAGTLPTDGTKWTEIADTELDRHIAYEQYGKQDIDRIVTIGNQNPRPVGGGWNWPTRPSGRGMDLPSYSGNTVWVTYVPRPPEFTTATYDATEPVSRGALRFDLNSGDCYRALAASTGKALTLPAYWLRQAFPYVIADYVKYAAAAEQADDIQLRATLAALADDKIKSEVDKLIAQGQTSFYGRNFNIPAKPFGITQPYYRAYWGSALTA